MALAEQRKSAAAAEKAAETERNAVIAERQRIAQDAALFEKAMKAMAPQEPDWDTARQTMTPDQFAATYAEWQIHQNRVRIAEDKRRQADARVEADKATAYTAYLSEQNALVLEMIPEWQDESVRKADAAAMRAFAKSKRFTDAQIDAVDDARTMVLLREAWQHAKSVTTRPVVRAEISRIKSATPGGAQSARKPVSQMAKDAATLKRTGRVDDAAKLFEHLVDL
jgi:hypothetical protein